MQNTIDFLQVMIHAVIALFAGMMRELNAINDKHKFNLLRLISSGAVSSFVGITTYFLLQNFDASSYFIAFCTSIGGWMGGNLMEYFSILVRKYITKKFDIDIDSNDEHSNDKNSC